MKNLMLFCVGNTLSSIVISEIKGSGILGMTVIDVRGK